MTIMLQVSNQIFLSPSFGGSMIYVSISGILSVISNEEIRVVPCRLQSQTVDTYPAISSQANLIFLQSNFLKVWLATAFGCLSSFIMQRVLQYGLQLCSDSRMRFRHFIHLHNEQAGNAIVSW